MMNSREVRVVDPVLSNHAAGYRHPDRVGGLLMPSVPVTVGGGKRIEFGKESFKRYNARRAPGAMTQRISFGYRGAPYELLQDALDCAIPREHVRDAEVPGVDMGMKAVETVMGALTLALECEQAELATDAANYAESNKIVLADGTKWSHADGDPVATIDAGKDVIGGATGMKPNTLVLSPDAWRAAKNNPSVTKWFTNGGGPVTLARFAELVEIPRVVVGEAVIANDDDTFSRVWNNVAVLAYAAAAPTGMEEPSFAYTYTMTGHPAVEEVWYDGNSKSWVYGVVYERAPVLTGISAGYLIQTPA